MKDFIEFDWLASGSLPGEAVLRAWVDQTFADLLVSDPTAALAMVGYQVPEGADISVKLGANRSEKFALPECPENISLLSELEISKTIHEFTACENTGTCD